MPTVLYAEDDSEHCLMMRIVLKDTHITLLEAVDGQTALQKIRDFHPDLILLDLFMPGLDGFGVMKAVKSDPAISHIPILVLSAWPTGDNQRRTKQAGAAEFVAKPYKPHELETLIKKYVSFQTDLELAIPKPGVAPGST